jgi:myo-inositol 2-dehydrogenase/D-chiro-inositol 1-dehydrogenase
MTIRVGIIGVGNIGTAHAENLAGAVSGACVGVVFDADTERATAVADRVGARTVASAQAVFEADDVDAVVVASPDGFHAQQVLAGLPRGKPILCEKPLAVAEADTRAIVDAEAAAGRRLIQVGFMRRFDPGYGALKAELGDEGIGEPLLVHNVHCNTEAPYGLLTEQTLTNMVIHEFDINRWLLDDDYRSVTVLAGRPGPHTPVGHHDPLVIVLRTAGDVLVQIEAFVNARYGYDVACRVVGSEGQSSMADGTWVTRAKGFARGVEVPELWLGRFAEAYRLQLQGWIDAVATRTGPPGATAWDGHVATLVANRAIESYRLGRGAGAEVAIELPDRPPLYDGTG